MRSIKYMFAAAICKWLSTDNLKTKLYFGIFSDEKSSECEYMATHPIGQHDTSFVEHPEGTVE